MMAWCRSVTWAGIFIRVNWICVSAASPLTFRMLVSKQPMISKLSAVHMCIKLIIRFDIHLLLSSWSCTDVMVAGQLDLMCYLADWDFFNQQTVANLVAFLNFWCNAGRHRHNLGASDVKAKYVCNLSCLACEFLKWFWEFRLLKFIRPLGYLLFILFLIHYLLNATWFLQQRTLSLRVSNP
jgi:hypothetical protein